MVDIAFLGMFFLVSLLITFGVCRYAQTGKLMDHPSERGAHSVSTPRGGGVSFVIVFLSILVWQEHYYLALAGFLVALIGWIDDHQSIKPLIRLGIHFIAAVITLLSIDNLVRIPWLMELISNPFLYGLVFVVGLVWFINLTNFMDGIDGLAASQALSYLLGSAGLLFIVFNDVQLAWLYVAFAVSILGFLILNWPPAKIFMGDAGSGFLGLMVGALLLYSAGLHFNMLWAGLILYALFIVDSTITLLKRLIGRESIHLPHNSHVYQVLARRFQSHKRVTMTALIINFCILMPVAYLVSVSMLSPLIGMAIVYIPLTIIVLKVNYSKNSISNGI